MPPVRPPGEVLSGQGCRLRQVRNTGTQCKGLQEHHTSLCYVQVTRAGVIQPRHDGQELSRTHPRGTKTGGNNRLLMALPPLRLGQLNLNGARDATMSVPAMVRELQLDAVLVQEQYMRNDNTRILEYGESPMAGIYVATNVAITCLWELCTEKCMVCHVGGPHDLYLVSSYFKYSDPIEPHLHQLERVLERLRGKRIIVGMDSNTHSPMWHSETRHYVGRGPGADARRRALEELILARSLSVLNEPGCLATYSGPNGESNIDLTLATRGTTTNTWRVLEGASTSDHRLITFHVDGPLGGGGVRRRAGETPQQPRYRDQQVDWVLYQGALQDRLGAMKWGVSAERVATQFTKAVETTAATCLGVVARKERDRGYEWWTPDLERQRRGYSRARRRWQNARRRKSPEESAAHDAMLRARSTYRWSIVSTEEDHFRRMAEKANADPWGMAYRAATGRSRPPRNVLNGLKLLEGHTCSTEEAMTGILRALCPDDNADTDTPYHRQVRLTAACTPSGRDSELPTRAMLEVIIRRLPNTAPGLDGLTSKIIEKTWRAAEDDMTRVMEACVREGVFPQVWKDGRLVVLPKENGKPPNDPKAYRPVTLLPILGKILERLMLRCAPSITRGLSPAQHGFTVGKSTTTALRDIIRTVKESRRKYVHATFLDIAGAFDNAWWPMMLVKAKRGGCPPNIYRMLSGYFVGRRVGLFAGSEVAWKTATMGCPQGSVLGPTLWNVLLDDLLRCVLPEGTSIIAYADDVTLMVEADSRRDIEAKAEQALATVCGWGQRNRLGFSAAKTKGMLLKGKLHNRPPKIQMQGSSIQQVKDTKVLGVVLDDSLLFTLHAKHAGERAATAYGKMSRISTTSWGLRYGALRTLYYGTYAAILTYAAGCWYTRVTQYPVRSALLRTQRPALILLTKAYRTTSTSALPVVAGVLPADLEVSRAGESHEIEEQGPLRREKIKVLHKKTVAKWQDRWQNDTKGRETHRFFPDVEERLKQTWIAPDHATTQLLTGHGCFRKRLYDLGLQDTELCYCGEEAEDMHHALWVCELYAEERKRLLDNITRNTPGPVYYADLVSSDANFRQFKIFARAWHSKRRGLEWSTGVHAEDE